MTPSSGFDLLNPLRAAVDVRRDKLTALIVRLVQQRSLLGEEEGAQQVVEEHLRELGFQVTRVGPDAAGAEHDPNVGYPPLSYEGRTCVAARFPGTGGSRSLHLSGHIDVVPVDCEEAWKHDPWGGEIVDGRVYGRGAGDMKGGLAALLIAAEAFLDVCGPPRGDLVFTSVIEEEITGNGMRAVLAAGFDADATLIGEPSGLGLKNGGVGVVWARLCATGEGRHAAEATPGDTPIERLLPAISALRALERELNAEIIDPNFQSLEHPYKLNLGELHSGVWTASVPCAATLRVRLGFGRDREPEAVQGLIADAVAAAAPAVEVVFEGMRARAYHDDLDDPFMRLLEGCHEELHGRIPDRGVYTATTDARHVNGPTVCYGPAAGDYHGIDEWVDLESARDCAVAVSFAAAQWLGKSPTSTEDRR